MSMSVSTNKRKGLIVPLSKKLDTQEAIFLVPGLGGHVFSLQLIARAISDDWMVYGMLHPVFVNDFVDTIEGSAALMVESILEKQDKGTFYVGGYSMGGLIAIEICRELIARGYDAKLVLLDTRPPEPPPLKPIYVRLPIYLRWYGERYFNKIFRKSRETHKVKSIAVYEDHNAVKKVPEIFKKAFQIGRASIAKYKVSNANIEAVLIRSNVTAWWDGLRKWEDDYCWSETLDVRQVVYCPGDHLDLVGADGYWQTTGEAIEKSLKILQSPLEPAAAGANISLSQAT